MADIFLIGAEPDLRHQLQAQSGMDGVNIHDLLDLEHALNLIERHESRPHAVVLGTLLHEPLRLAQQIHRIDREIALLILSYEGQRRRVMRAVQFTPFLGDQVSTHNHTDIPGIVDVLQNAGMRGDKRKKFRSTIAAMNQQLGSLSTHRISAVQYLDHVLDHAPVGIVILDQEWRVLSSNRTAGKILEWSERELLGASLLTIFSEEERQRLSEFLSSSRLSDSTNLRQVFSHITGTDDSRYIEATCSPLPSDTGDSVTMVILQDVTVQIINEREREAAIQLRNEFLSMAAHELKTPLTSTKGFVELVRRQLKRPDWNQERILRLHDQLYAQVDRLELLVLDLLDVSRIRQGGLDPHPEPLDLSSLVGEVLQRFSELPEDEQTTLELVLDAPEPVNGTWDPGRLDQVITNLVSNAIKYSPNGGTVTVSVRKRGNHAELSVRDQGVGIDPELRERLFDPFVRGDVGGNVPGTGLGLYISQQIVNQHGGTIAVTGESGKGSTFTVRLPLNTQSTLLSLGHTLGSRAT